ncbi:hypothetical protein EDD86DRAFT_212610 [Gorgonomyces haynaldii]|nr:hypothetical protein EDD86DRAFT_212610 [Gorgonomyces haynaldii]
MSLKQLSHTQLIQQCKQLQLDSDGPKETLISRITLYNKMNNKSVSQKKRRKKAKRVKEMDQEEPEQEAFQVEVVPEEIEMDQGFEQVLENFQQLAQRKVPREQVVDENQESSESEDEEMDYETRVQSKKKLRKMGRVPIAVLKEKAKRTEVVEWTDATAQDPFFLVELKSYRNTVPVPAHWSNRRKFLQGKRGTEKIPYELPEYVKETGIMELRDPTSHSNRNRYKAKMGKLDIDYQKLYEAFFKNQTKPPVSVHGEIYYEGKEFEAKMKNRKPGSLSEDLIIALNMPPGAPPPWLLNMQRHGPPPSYPQLKIPGLNCPIPQGAQWGFHPGGWGKPPVDEFNRPLFGDVFGLYNKPPPSEVLDLTLVDCTT